VAAAATGDRRQATALARARECMHAGSDSLTSPNMAMNHEYSRSAPSRAEIEAMPGPVLLEFGTPWCGYCRAAQPLLEAALADHPSVRHLKIEDGRGRRLGRSYGVKHWPTLIFLRDGSEVTRLVRPIDTAAIREALAQIDGSG